MLFAAGINNLGKEAKKLKVKFCSGAFLEDMWIRKRNLNEIHYDSPFPPQIRV